MKRCGKCNTLNDDTLQVCAQDGSPLEPDFIAAELQEALGEKYALTHLIGQGSMGAVYRARHRDLDDVAIKIMLGQKNNAQLSERFLREARALRRLRHPNAVLVYDLERSPKGLSYMVMEMVKGSSLRQELDARGKLPLEDAVTIAEAICAALQEAHEHGIIHRDVKPDNILVAEEALASGRLQKRIKLVDFGVVKLPTTPEGDPTAPITRSGTPIGTPFYMSPEQWFGEGPGLYSVDNRADIYGLGCTMYEMLSGRVPFLAETTKEMRRMHLQADPEPLIEVAPGVPVLVSDVIMRALAKDREERQASAAVFAAELRAAYEESFRETAQLSAERLAAARASWGASDAPYNEQQMAPTIKPLPSESEAVSLDAEETVDNVKVAADDRPVITGPPDGTTAQPPQGMTEAEASAWAATAEPEPPAPGDTLLGGLPKKTQRLEIVDTVRGRLRDLTTPPQPPPLKVAPDIPAAKEVKAIEAPLPMPVAPARDEPAPPNEEERATTHQLILPESAFTQSPPPLPQAPPPAVQVEPPPAVQVEPPAPQPVAPLPVTPPPRPRWPKVVLGSVLALLLAGGGALLYWKWPRPDAPNTNQSDAPSDPNVKLPGFGLITVNAAKGSIIFVDDERVASTGDNNTAGAQAAAGLRNVRVQPPGDNLRPFIKDVAVPDKGTVEVRAAFARPPEPGPAATRQTRTQEALARGDFPMAEAEYRQQIADTPGNADARMGLAQVLSAQKRYSDALSELETISRMMPKNPVLLREMARLYAVKKQDVAAERTLLQAIGAAPRNRELHTDFALLLARQPGRLDDALREADAGLKGRETAEALDAKARVLIERNANEEALKLAERAARRDPRDPRWQATLAVALARAGRRDAALQKYRPLLQKYRDDWNDRKNLGMLRFYGNNFLDTAESLIAGR
jgi:serine/threonine-protein kinase